MLPQPGALWALTAAGNGEIGAHDGLDGTPLTCTNTPGVSSDASLNHWMEPGSREKSMQIDGSGRVQLVQSMPVLRPDEQVLQLMLDGWRNQQLSRNLQFATIEQRLRCVQRFLGHVNEDPWNWTPAMVEEFSADLRTVKHVSHSTLRGYHSAVRALCISGESRAGRYA
jgi:hypothetical protein